MAKEKTEKKADKGSAMSVEAMMAQFAKDMGPETVTMGPQLVDADRIPTGCFPFDLATGGGFPKGKATIIFGKESSGKTNLALLAIAAHQKIWPDQKCVFVDVENAFNPKWAAALGVDVSRLFLVKPSYGEQMVDIVEGLMHAPDCGLVVIDSLAAVISTMEIENSAEKKSYGGNSILIGLLARKTTLAMNEQSKHGRHPTLIYINQTRTKVGLMFGNPEDMPGGQAPKFQANMIVHVYGSNVMNAKFHPTMPVIKKIEFVIKKWKHPIIAQKGTLEMVMVPHDGFKPGEVDDWNTVSEYLKNFGQFNKGPKDKGWVILEEPYPTIKAFQDRLFSEPNFGAEVRSAIIQRVMMDGDIIEGQAEEEAAQKEWEAAADA